MPRISVLFLCAGLLVAYCLRDTRESSALRGRNLYNNMTVLVVCLVFYFQRRRIAALFEGLIVALGCSALTKCWWWLEDFFTGSSGAAEDLPPLGGLDEAEPELAAATRSAGTPHHSQGNNEAQLVPCSRGAGQPCGSCRRCVDAEPAQHAPDIAMGLNIDLGTQQKWHRDVLQFAHDLSIFQALLPKPRKRPRCRTTQVRRARWGGGGMSCPPSPHPPPLPYWYHHTTRTHSPTFSQCHPPASLRLALCFVSLSSACVWLFSIGQVHDLFYRCMRPRIG